LLIASLVAACAPGATSEARPQRPSARASGRWFCAEDSLCFPTQDECARSGEHGVKTCGEPLKLAACRDVCNRTSSGFPSCRLYCFSDLDLCQTVPDPGSCSAQAPPDNPYLYPNYGRAGWWCWEETGADGRALSQCVKHEETCEWNLRNTETKVGLSHAGRCQKRDDATCFSLKLGGILQFQCAMTAEACEVVRAAQTAQVSPLPVRDVSACRLWAPEQVTSWTVPGPPR
jgi:hypothetical protein